MRESVASVLMLNIDQVSIKATTTERLGFVGKEEGIASYAVVMLVKE
jgi:2-C-methyl-D-erythritol 2,4-cyclodiphosphate synthase